MFQRNKYKCAKLSTFLVFEDRLTVFFLPGALWQRYRNAFLMHDVDVKSLVAYLHTYIAIKDS